MISFVFDFAKQLAQKEMFSKLTTLAMMAMLISVTLANVTNYEKSKKQRLQDIFENDSDFMRGFETGLFLRTKGGTVEDYGCRVGEEGNKKAKMAFDMIKSNIELAKNNLKLDPIIDEALTLVTTFLDGLYGFITVLSPSSGIKLDMYCTGMVFGLQGSKLLVQVANTLINPIKDDGDVAGTFEKKKMPSIGGFFDKLSEGVMNTVKDTFAMGGNSGKKADENKKEEEVVDEL